MRLDPDRELSPGTVAAIRDLIGPPDVPQVDDASLLRLALGIADAETRLACARAALASPGVRSRLMRIREGLAREVWPGVGAPSGEDLADLGRLGAFAGPFGEEDAAAVFPGRFGRPGALARMAGRGWLEEAGGGLLALPPRIRSLVGVPSDAGGDEGWPDRLVRRYAERATDVDRLLSEGRWSDGSALLRRDLPGLRAAWELADGLGAAEAVERFARALAPPLMETGEREAFAGLVAAGYRAAERLEDARLRSWLLSYEGAEASYRGDSPRARALWRERLALCRRLGHRVSEADTLLDLAGQAQTDGDARECRRLLAEAEPVVAETGNADYAATLRSHRALLCLAEGRPEEAAAEAREALEGLEGTQGAAAGLFVRLTVARTLARCGDPDAALAASADVLARSVEHGRAVDAAAALADLARLLEAMGRAVLADRCLAVALGVHRRLGARRLASTEADLAALRARHPALRGSGPSGEAWEAGAAAILRELREGRAAAAR